MKDRGCRIEEHGSELMFILQLAVANAQQLINKINENCFAKCVTKPSTELTGSQETCLSQCMGLYMAAFDQVSRSYVQRISKERGGLPGL
ncbi:mitochondrial import inner membrane translocase subunit TIM13, variant 1 [Cryptococcus amylolentus CBS 6039]|uniref:Mitochondrial import inner membrane translocase subunit n=1 Tax=Cryptococcus amylolentus CBS 6039 TaxID=1295533 RepID=A0A1E3HBS9_9TREE|nr:mitochondrial import inner membrane translocase subunit TIM13, variant 1 [Cryptococcus amylolentus CBS 6039]ODN72901.1 mitochondrial import inner membrane translocase subunit TIM13, variant 1 [Cryptococcus amylolentus CBS 6039]